MGRSGQNHGRLARRDQLLKKFSAESAENDKIAHEDLFGVENSLKAIRGYESGLKDMSLMAKKSAEEGKMRQAVSSDAAKQKEFGDPWAEIAKAMDTEKQFYLPLTYFERLAGLNDMGKCVRLRNAKKPRQNGHKCEE